MCHSSTEIDWVSLFARDLLTFSAWYDKVDLLTRWYFWAVLRTFNRTILFKRIVETLILKRVATAAKARAAFYFNSLWQSSISKFNFPQVTCITLLFIAWIFVATERKLVFVRLHGAMTVFLVLLKAVLTSLGGHLWLCAKVILNALSLIDSMAWKTIHLQLWGRILLRAFG